MKLPCGFCKEEVFTEPFIYDARILTSEPLCFEFERPHYEARVNVNFICSVCGRKNDQIMFNDISKEDIIRLAIGE